MTCIIGTIQKNHIEFAADSLGSNYYTNIGLWDSKIHVYKFGSATTTCEMIVGSSGQIGVMNLLKYTFSPPNPWDKKETGMSYLVHSFVPALRDLLKDNGFSVIKDSQHSTDNSTILIGLECEDRVGLYTIQNDFSVIAHESHIAAIGSGREIALGAAYALSDVFGSLNSLNLENCIKIAAHNIPTVGGQIHLTRIRHYKYLEAADATHTN